MYFFSQKRWGVLLILCSLVSVCFLSTAAAKSHPAPMKEKDFLRMPIMGEAIATKEQCLQYLLRVNPSPSLTVSPKKLVDHYYEEAKREGIRPDIAFAQALHETGYFRYGGLVKPKQNNYCGLGSMGKGKNGASFKTSQVGVRAHIQHILAYASTRAPRAELVDPRYRLVKTTRNFGRAKTWADLNGKWAVPGHNYAQKIFTIYRGILAES